MLNNKSFLPVLGLAAISPESLAVIPPFTTALKGAIHEVKAAANDAGASTDGFIIDSAFCDVADADGNVISTSKVADIIAEFGIQFGPVLSPEYNLAVDTLCEAVNQAFVVS